MPGAVVSKQARVPAFVYCRSCDARVASDHVQATGECLVCGARGPWRPCRDDRPPRARFAWLHCDKCDELALEAGSPVSCPTCGAEMKRFPI
jgi:Zn finger protein HypA/HybF involved in hydrogenase expression